MSEFYYAPLEEFLEGKDLTYTEEFFLMKMVENLVELPITTNDYPYYEGKIFGLKGINKNTAAVWCRILESKNMVELYPADYFTQPIVQLSSELFYALDLLLSSRSNK
jgi:hypothetical protein